MRSNTSKLQSEIDKLRQINEELEKKTRLQNLKIERLTEEKKELAKQVLKERRLRYAARNLVVGVDKAILAQIERINAAPRSPIKPSRQQAINLDKPDALGLVNTLQAADLESYYSRKGPARPKRKVVYKSVYAVYSVPRFMAIIFLKSILKLRKAGKKAG